MSSGSWTSVTCLPGQDWLYAAIISDACARLVVCWLSGTSMDAEFVLDTLEQALRACQPQPGAPAKGIPSTRVTANA
jgi:transposase InsO family protein